MLRYVLVVLCLVINAWGWINNYGEQVNFQCQEETQFVSSIHSVSVRDDRVWYFGCSELPVENVAWANCQWLGFINNFGQDLDFDCPFNGHIRGVNSVYNGAFGDRTFNFFCCFSYGTMTHACETTDWVNQLEGSLSYTVPSDKFLRGVKSYYDPQTKDRRFQFGICSMRG